MLMLTAIQVAACGYVLWVCCMVLKRMSKDTRHLIRWSYLALTGAAFSGIVCDKTIPGALFAIGVAIYFACNERTERASKHQSVS